jgi:hypothetical protein
VSTTIGNLAVILSANAAGFTQGFAAAQKTAGSFIGTMGMMAKTAGTIVGIGTAASIVQTAFKGFTGAEESRITFQALLGDAEKAKKFKAELKDFGDMTPFGDGVGAAAKELLKFNVGADEIIPSLKQLGDIAAGLDVPLEGLATIFGEVKYKGELSKKQLVSLTEQGVPLVQELMKTMNLSEGSVLSLVDQGKVGFAEFQSALASATGAGGNFFGMMEARANTTKGLMGRIVDQTGDVVGKLGSVIGDRVSAMFGTKSGMSAVFDWLQEVEEGVKNMGPWFDNVILYFQTVGDVITSVWTGVSAVFTGVWDTVGSIFDSMGATVGGFRDLFIEAMLSVRFTFNNFGAISELIFEKFKLGLALMGNDAWHLFSVNIPELLGWLARNWKGVFTDLYEMTITIFTNIGKNIWNFFTNIPGLIAGTVDFKDIWTPLTEGFETSIKETLQFTKREYTQFEKDQIAKIGNLDAALGAKKEKFFAEEMAKLNGAKQGSFVTDFVKDVAFGGGQGKQMNGELAKVSKASEVKFSAAFDRGSKEAYNVILRSRYGDSGAPANRTAKATEDTVKAVRSVEKAIEKIPSNSITAGSLNVGGS